MSLYRGGILEPAGAVEIKFRRKDLVKAMRRLDDAYSKLIQKLATPGAYHPSSNTETTSFPATDVPSPLFSLDLSIKDRKTLEKELKEREELLLPVYQQVGGDIRESRVK